MNGVRDYAAARIAEHGLELHASFDGRYLYVATQDAGGGSDHFVFVTTNPAAAVSAPWAKSGQVAPWIAFLADENDLDFCGWFDAAGARITDLARARAVTNFENGGSDDDFDGASNLQEYRAGTRPTDPDSVFRLVGLTSTGVLSTAVQGHAYVLEISTNPSVWFAVATNAAPADFPESTLHAPWLPASSAWLRLRLAP